MSEIGPRAGGRHVGGVICHETGDRRGPVFEVYRSCWGPHGSGTAWSPQSGVVPTIEVRRWPYRQLELDLGG